uniref:BSD domain-containing protein n=1 Tax=Haptolina ericina TaxID=156174 RepID=A0A7S3ETQ8_9EUKA|mmetsp:Transcript_22713/g.51402  ORF Transcript_22713/g.51402 Transcript_22713/m.51402 type:complete len:229 (+) Transcript_22713:114-800(+)
MEISQLDCMFDPSSSSWHRPGNVIDAHVLQQAMRKSEALLAQDVQTGGNPPWLLLSEKFSILEPELELRCRAISMLSASAFLAPLPGMPDAFERTTLPAMLPAGTAALAQDPELERLRYRLVPTQVSDSGFWYSYFHHVAKHRRDVLPVEVHGARHEDDFEDFLTSPLKRSPSPPDAPLASPPRRAQTVQSLLRDPPHRDLVSFGELQRAQCEDEDFDEFLQRPLDSR